MSEQKTADATATGAEATESQDESKAKPTETVEFWREKAREQEKRAKANADAAKRLADIEESQKSEAQKAADRIAELERQVADSAGAALRFKVASKYGIDAEAADLILTASDEETLMKQAELFSARADERKKQGNRVPKEGTSTQKGTDDDEMREFTKQLFATPAD